MIIPIVLVVLTAFFSSEDCLPAKRKFHNMLDDIRIYQDLYNDKNDIKIQYKGKTFNVRVVKLTEGYSYIRYDVYINDEKVFTYRILEHCFSKSREGCYCRDRLVYEVDEILKATHKYTKKAREDSWKTKYSSKSYFD